VVGDCNHGEAAKDRDENNRQKDDEQRVINGGNNVVADCDEYQEERSLDVQYCCSNEKTKSKCGMGHMATDKSRREVF